ncbi:MAG: carboxypeptidase, partial [Leuconostoc mesenteroides]
FYQALKSGRLASDDNAGMPEKAISAARFTGYTKAFPLSVWTGFDVPSKNYIPWTEQDLPAQYYAKVMAYAMQNKSNTDWTAPDTVTAKVKGNIVEYEVKDASWSNGGLPSVNSIAQSGETPSEAGISANSASTGSTTGNN